MEGRSDEAFEDIRNSLEAITIDETKRLITDVTKRRDLAISNICNELCEVEHLLKGFNGGSSSKRFDQNSKGLRSIKLNLPRFSDEDPQ